ncbi:unnamed protein product [Rotaria magnacalcarata]|uniref:NAD(P)(+)--arginine ADP-ribosyltransferase n=1 Tax=Rotaria magnacalcarata TaxID=392030 RepID=A0A816ZGI0_9BILA|nr:unnamed protein product [Rotaria magnacalcarata]CAF3867693.1 unnamed protein product [Rotaria magnacalcarata]
MATAFSFPTSNKRVVWFWQSNPDPWDESKEKQWKRYSDFETEFIEQEFQKDQKEVELNDYVINFKREIQHKKDDHGRQRPVKREEVDLNQYVREERVCLSERAAVLNSFEEENKNKASLGSLWFKKNYFDINDNESYKAVAELAAQGILKEGSLLNHEFDAQKMAEKLRTFKSRIDILNCIVSLYTAESFLYKLVNISLRNSDMTKVNTLGPFCWLLYVHLAASGGRGYLVVYRGMTLTDEEIEEYKQALGKWIIWRGFTSTTKDRNVAEQFGNTLFVITNMTHDARMDIFALSHYPHEQEVLIQCNGRFEIEEIEYDSAKEKYVIHMMGSY